MCNEDNGSHLYSFRSLKADRNLRRIASDLQDYGLPSPLWSSTSGGGVIATIVAKYHMRFLTDQASNND